LSALVLYRAESGMFYFKVISEVFKGTITKSTLDVSANHPFIGLVPDSKKWRSFIVPLHHGGRLFEVMIQLLETVPKA
jgi:hypothetical protein